MAIDRKQDRWIDAPFRIDGPKPLVEVRIIALAPPDKRRSDVFAQIRRQRSHDTATAAGDRFGALEFDHTLVQRQIGNVRLDRRFANPLLARERGEPNLVGVPGAPDRRRVSGLPISRGLRRRGAERGNRQRNQQPAAQSAQRMLPHQTRG